MWIRIALGIVFSLSVILQVSQDYPSKPVRMIEPFGAGGGPDLLAHALSPQLSKLWGQPVMVENYPGAGSTAAPALVAKSPADGYTLLVNTSAHAYSAALLKNLPYEPLKDFIPVVPDCWERFGKELKVSKHRVNCTESTGHMFLVRAHNPKVVSSKCDPRNRPPHSHAASEKLNSVVRVVQTGPPAPFLPSHFPIACVECRGSYGNRVRRARGRANRYMREEGSFVRGRGGAWGISTESARCDARPACRCRRASEGRGGRPCPSELGTGGSTTLATAGT